MERVGTLIHKLLEQYEQQVQAGRLLMTAQMLIAELQQHQQAAGNNAFPKVSVVIPAASMAARDNSSELAVTPVPEPAVMQAKQEPIQVMQQQEEEPVPEVPELTPVVVTEPAPQAVAAIVPPVEQLSTPVIQPVAAPMPQVPTVAPAPKPEYAAYAASTAKVAEQEQATISEICTEPEKPQPVKSWPFDPVFEVPTLTHQDLAGKTELNESILKNGESLNERLRVEKIELGSMLQGSPIRDLKKAIGINDRYLFINELFRGDETMYERSLKTINGFTILPEAEYWIQRELKVKLGWSEQSESVHHFDQLVRRRFS